MLCIISVTLGDKFQVRVDEYGPKKLPELELKRKLAVRQAVNRRNANLVNLEIVLNPIPQQYKGFEVSLRTRVLASLRRPPVRAEVSRLLTKDGLGFGETFLFQVIRDLAGNQ